MDYIGLINLIIVMYKVKFYWGGGGIPGSPPPVWIPGMVIMMLVENGMEIVFFFKLEISFTYI